MTPRSVGIFGLGLMGGSLARDLASRGVEVWGHDRDPAALDAAVAEGIVRHRLDPDARPLEPLDLYVLATPVDTAADLLRSLTPRLPPGSLVTDLGSTKSEICRVAAQLGLHGRFVGSHPLAGDHRSGWAAARGGLYQGATVFLCPLDGDRAEDLVNLWRALGAHPVIVDPDEHDRRMAWVSHLPQLLASALAIGLDDAGLRPADLGPGGRDMTRLAASSAEMWAAITVANADALREALQQVQSTLSSLGDALDRHDSDALLRFFRAANRWAD